ncbi:MAG: response regulator transcription factor [Chitinophagaceae bacterium]|nr:response regulator transcription factor [Chitinophagaceae bacterium]
MPIKKVIIADDEAAARIILQQYLDEYPEMEVIAQCQDGLEAVAAIDRLEPDLVFLDIQMPGLSGFQVLRQIIHVPQIIFTTAYDQYALKAFDSNAIDYLLKPYTRERFNQAVAKVLTRQGSDLARLTALTDVVGQPEQGYPERILLENGNKMISLAVQDIAYLAAEKDYTRIHTLQKNFLSNYGIGVLEQRLNPSVFIRVHRSHIVNIHHIREVYKESSDAYLVLNNDVSLKVSRGYIDNLKKLMY